MRRGFDTLSGLIREHMQRDPLSGDVYLFINRNRDRIKMLVWDRSGFWLLYKRLERGRFQVPPPGSPYLTYETLIMLLEGIDLASVRRKKRYKMSEITLA